MTYLLIALAAAAGVLLLVALGRRAAGRPVGETAELAAAVADVSARLEELDVEVARAVDRAGTDSRRGRALEELSGSIDLDEVVTRTLEAATATGAVDAALVSVSALSGETMTAALGLPPSEADQPPLTGPPDGGKPRAIALSYLYEQSAEGKHLLAGLAVPLSTEGQELGWLAGYSRTAPDALDEHALGALEELAQRAGPAIDNARRFREARQLADIDALTGLHNRRYFHETLAREVARAHRYSRQLGLIVFDLDDFKEINDRIGHLAGDSVLAEAAERIRAVVRSADIACRVGGDEFAVVLPESSLQDADQLYHRLQHAVSARPVGEAGELFLSAGVAELQPEDDSVALFERADNALYRAKNAGKGRVIAAGSS